MKGGKGNFKIQDLAITLKNIKSSIYAFLPACSLSVSGSWVVIGCALNPPTAIKLCFGALPRLLLGFLGTSLSHIPLVLFFSCHLLLVLNVPRFLVYE